MEKHLVEIFNILAILTVVSFPFIKPRGRTALAMSVLSVQALLVAYVAIVVFINGGVSFTYPGSWITGEISIKIDYLSAWFMLLISFTFITGAWYGQQYIKQYKKQTSNIALHVIAFILAFTSLIDLCTIQNGFFFIIIWEIMALSSFIIIIFESNKTDTIKAGINFLIQSHIAILFLTLGFMWIKIKTGSFDFEAITSYTAIHPAAGSLGLFLVFFVGFAIKAGFVPFHTWLPLAHPAAPAHISGVMSGVIIKIGIYGILRMLLIIKTDMITLGYFITTISVITGIYGVMLAIVQHNLKKLLAYHSIENIGIIGIGIGVGTLGLGYGDSVLVVCGFAGALLHTLNHSLFKSLLFYGAGNIYQTIHTMDIEEMGGLLKKMPKTGWLFLTGSLAICGLPPLNGFVSEFFIYTGLFNGLISGQFIFSLFILFAILGLVLIGGLALICFTKAFGIVFLGNPRKKFEHIQGIETKTRIFPMYAIASAIIIIGVFPLLFLPAIEKIVGLFSENQLQFQASPLNTITGAITKVGLYSIAFIALTSLLLFVRQLIIGKRSVALEETWGCGYTGDSSKMQYTASSFVRTYRKLAGPILYVKKEKKEASGLYPKIIKQTTHPGDSTEIWLIDKPLKFLRTILNKFAFLQNGNIQAYILYGLLFVALAIILPLIIDKVSGFLTLINRL